MATQTKIKQKALQKKNRTEQVKHYAKTKAYIKQNKETIQMDIATASAVNKKAIIRIKEPFIRNKITEPESRIRFDFAINSRAFNFVVDKDFIIGVLYTLNQNSPDTLDREYILATIIQLLFDDTFEYLPDEALSILVKYFYDKLIEASVYDLIKECLIELKQLKCNNKRAMRIYIIVQ